jgi:hypothetical protein
MFPLVIEMLLECNLWRSEPLTELPPPKSAQIIQLAFSAKTRLGSRRGSAASWRLYYCLIRGIFPGSDIARLRMTGAAIKERA